MLASVLVRSGIKPAYYKHFLLLWTSSFLALMGFGLTLPLLSVRIIEKGISLQEFGVLQATATVVSILSQVFIGKLSDALGRRKPFVVAAFAILFPVALLFPSASTLCAFLILLSVNQLGINTFSGMITAWVSSYGIEGQIGRVHGAFRISSSCGWITATPLVGFFLDNYGFASVFYVAAVLFFLVGVLVLSLARETLSMEQAASWKKASFPWPFSLKVAFAALTLFSLSQAMGFHLNFVFLMHELGVTNSQFGWLSSIQAWPEVPLMLFFGIASDKWKGPQLLAIGMMIAGIRWLLLSLATEPTTVFFIQPLHSVGITVVDVLLIAYIVRLVPPQYLGTAISWKITCMNVARMVGPLLAGWLGDTLGMRPVFFLSGLLGIVSGVFIFYMSMNTVKRGMPKVP